MNNEKLNQTIKICPGLLEFFSGNYRIMNFHILRLKEIHPFNLFFNELINIY